MCTFVKAAFMTCIPITVTIATNI